MTLEADRNRLERMAAEYVQCLVKLDKQMLLRLCRQHGRDRFLRQTWRDHEGILSALNKFQPGNWTPPAGQKEQEEVAVVLLSTAYILRVALAYLQAATALQDASFGQGKARGLRQAEIAFQAHMQHPTFWPFDDGNDPFDEIY